MRAKPKKKNIIWNEISFDEFFSYIQGKALLPYGSFTSDEATHGRLVRKLDDGTYILIHPQCRLCDDYDDHHNIYLFRDKTLYYIGNEYE